MRTLCPLLLLCGCYDPVYGLEESGVLGGGSDACPTDTDPASADVSAVLLASCGKAGCHAAGATAPAMDCGAEALLDQTSSTGMAYITPGDLENSYLWLKVDGCTANHSTCSGSAMPLGATLAAGDIQIIQDWISPLP